MSAPATPNPYIGHKDIMEFLASYVVPDTDYPRLTQLIWRLDAVIPENTVRNKNQRIGQTFWNNVMEDCVLPEKATVGLSVMFSTDDPIVLKQVVYALWFHATRKCMRIADKTTYEEAEQWITEKYTPTDREYV
jgi:hypothetical protein